MSKVKTLIVKTDMPIRLDRYIKRCFPLVTQGTIEKAVRKRQIKLNGLKTSANTRIVEGDKITYALGILVLEDSDNTNKIFSKSTLILAKKLLSEYLIYSSLEFIAINKPSGLAVQGGSKINLSIDDALNYLNMAEGEEYKIVHRLDKETSGILLIANGYSNAAKLSDAFQKHLIHKTYTAIVFGVPNSLSGNLIHYIGKDRQGIFETVTELKEGGKKAETEYKVIRSSNNRSMIEFKPKTGRMHQLRFHSKFLGCPIIGDKKYGGQKSSRMLLHAKELIIEKSVFGSEIKIKSALPQEFDLL
ncbi:MAG: RluA family pseudouridine synthase [Rickettsiaceae bacterium]|nr:RluA family pseudouridine synthase [Rickettsiaceae bacterium]